VDRRQQISPARITAFNILQRVEAEKSYAANLLAANDNQLSAADRRLSYELVLGVLRWQLQLDYLVEKLGNRALQKLDTGVLIALRLGLYQLRFLSRIPSSAAVNESVELIKRSRYKSAAGFVNAVLRRAIKDADGILSGEGSNKKPPSSVLLSHPDWLLEKWSKQFGTEQTQKLAVANNQTPATAFRFNPLKADIDQTMKQITSRGLELTRGKLASTAYYIAKASAAELNDLAESGVIYFQEEASQLVADLVSVNPGQKILDLCAAPGSKTTQIAADMNNQGLLIAADLHPQRLRTLMKVSKTLAVKIVRPIALNAGYDLPIVNDVTFDAVLVDAPCSGTGTLRHNPEIKWRLRRDQIEELGNLQSRILNNASKYVKVDGRLVYSTCSLEREEDENVVLDFLKSHPDFELLRLKNVVITEEGFVRTFPHLHGTDGFFAAVLRKTSESGANYNC